VVIPFLIFTAGMAFVVTGLQAEPTDMQSAVGGFFLLAIAWVVASRKDKKEK
jgi:hypothetical protein